MGYDIRTYGDPVLAAVAEEVENIDGKLVRLSQSMLQAMYKAPGLGLAAPQIGVNLQVVIFGSTRPNPRYPDRPLVPPTVLINPRITPLGPEEQEDWEGCLSVPGLRGWVPRWARIRYSGFDEKGQAIEREVEGFHARVVQHECDHLFGQLYPMRMRDLSRLGFTEVLFPEISAAEDD